MTSMFALWAGALLASGSPVTEVAITSVAEQTSVLIAVNGSVQHRAFTMEGPHRLVVDLMGAENALPRDEFTGVNRGGIRNVRASQYSAEVVRVVFELSEQMAYDITSDDDGLRITLQNPQVRGFEPWSSGASAMSAFDPTSLSLATGSQAQQLSQAERISMRWTEEPLQNVLLHFATFSGKSIVPGANVFGFVTAEIINQPWDVALQVILSANGLVGEEDVYGMIRVENLTDVEAREQIGQIETRAHRIRYATAAELVQMITPLLTERGSITENAATNTLVVSDIDRVQRAIQALLQQIDIETPQVSITAKIIFVNRTDLREMGVTYELKDSRGNQLNTLSDGASDLNGDGVLSLPEETVEQGTSVVSLGGNSIAALGNAAARVGNPTLSMVTSMVVGRHQLVSFLDALQSVNLSDIEASPQVTVLDNVEAELSVGELTPIRTIDAGAGGAGTTFPTAQVQQQETGIILRATPHVVGGGKIRLDIYVERSAAELAESDAGFIFRQQKGTTRMLVADGETAVIAGLVQSERTESIQGIPILMNLPILGKLFRVTREQVLQRDLIILVTPHIVRGTN
ncbi:MAG: AMIN domain-containing protein [Gemmatimonadales bacterium]|nr:AMIN domain-containing protein [Gemmatimonadales bacterium]